LQTLDVDERGRAAAAALLQEVRGLSEMVTSFLNFARPKPLDPADVSLSELVESCRAEVEKLYGELRVELRVEGEFPDVRADERLLRQALLNVMRNAAEAVGEESSERRVVVRGSGARGEGGREFAVVEVADTGGGIPEDDLRRIFIPFFTTKSKGHGIGLALAHRVVTDHGGTLTARNDAREGGAVFRITLPL
jgi:signal transduction histidine kinase